MNHILNFALIFALLMVITIITVNVIELNNEINKNKTFWKTVENKIVTLNNTNYLIANHEGGRYVKLVSTNGEKIIIIVNFDTLAQILNKLPETKIEATK